MVDMGSMGKMDIQSGGNPRPAMGNTAMLPISPILAAQGQNGSLTRPSCQSSRAFDHGTFWPA